jgi:hypothetical protein
MITRLVCFFLLITSLPVYGGLDAKLANVSIRGRVAPGDDTLIAGFFVPTDSAAILIRGVGPSLAPFGIKDCLSDPQLTVYDSKGAVVAKSLRISDLNFVAHEQLISIFARAGAFPILGLTSDSVMFIGLPPGAYTLHITSKSGGSGIVLGEIYTVTYDFPYGPIQG